jgi:hypothetical protein
MLLLVIASWRFSPPHFCFVCLFVVVDFVDGHQQIYKKQTKKKHYFEKQKKNRQQEGKGKKRQQTKRECVLNKKARQGKRILPSTPDQKNREFPRTS